MAQVPVSASAPGSTLLSMKSCYVQGCTRAAGWLVHDEEYGDMESCADHAGYEDSEQMQAELDADIAKYA